MADRWQNRIVGHGVEAPDQLLANPMNWRIHPKAQQEALTQVLDRVGWVQDVIVNQRTGHVVDGHLRVSVAISRQEAEVPVVYVDLDEAEEALILASLDPLAGMAVTDEEMIAQLLEGVETEGALAAMLDNVMARGMTAEERLAEWGGMPEFAQEDQTAWRSLVVNFAGPEDLEKFAELVGQPLTPKSRSIWYPEAAIGHYANKRFADGES